MAQSGQIPQLEMTHGTECSIPTEARLMGYMYRYLTIQPLLNI